jgi:hypothetical protein
MKYFLFMLSALLFSTAAISAEITVPQQPQTVVIDKKACRYLIKHYMQPDVQYQPGVDARGKKVVPADLASGAGQIKLPDTITINLTSELKDWLPNQNYPNNRLSTSEIPLGTITVEGDKVTYNGQPLTDPAQEQLAVLCLQPN